jgi:hypothetical protein
MNKIKVVERTAILEVTHKAESRKSFLIARSFTLDASTPAPRANLCSQCIVIVFNITSVKRLAPPSSSAEV